MRLSVVLIGSKGSGKSSLAHAAFGCPSPELDLSSRAEKESRILQEHSVHSISLLDTKTPTTKKEKMWLGQELARRTVRTVLLTVARNHCNTEEASEWTSFAREHCPNAHLALVVTKNDLRSLKDLNRASHSAKSLLSEHAFDSSMYNIMQMGGGADSLFYTSSETRRGTSDLLNWVLDKCADDGGLGDFGCANTRFKKKRKKILRQRSCSVDGCDTCLLQ